ELAVAPMLVRQAAAEGWRARYTAADQGFDSEALHREVQTHLRCRLVAPLNDRGGGRSMRRTPLRAWLNQRWSTPLIQAIIRLRAEVERMYGVLKSWLFSLYALPPWVRRIASVRRWT